MIEHGAFQKHQQLEGFWPLYVKPAHDTRFRATNSVPKASTNVLTLASPPLTAKTDPRTPGAITDKVALITSGVICDALLIGSISFQLYNLLKSDAIS